MKLFKPLLALTMILFVALAAVSAHATLIEQYVGLQTDQTNSPHSLTLWLDNESVPCDFFQVAIVGASVGDLSLGSACDPAHWSVETNTVNGHAVFHAACDNPSYYITGGEILQVDGCGWSVDIDVYMGLPYTTLHGSGGGDTWDVTEWPYLTMGIAGQCPNKVSIASAPSTWSTVKRLYH